MAGSSETFWSKLAGKTPTSIPGWFRRAGAFPAFYNSMSEHEIETLVLATDDAWSNGRGVWSHLGDYVGALDWNLRYRRPSQNPVHDPIGSSQTSADHKTPRA